MGDETINKINKVITHYFETHTKVDWIPAKKIMPALIEAGVFVKDERKGLPLRKVLRKLEAQGDLDKISQLHAEQAGGATYWYFVREGASYMPKEPIPTVTKKEQHFQNIKNSDEYYLVDLCDDLLGEQASRKHTFDALVGNLHKRGKGRTKLPVDAYYEHLKLVIEFYRTALPLEDLDEKEQARIAQIKYYDELKKKAVLKKELSLVAIDYAAFKTDEHHKLIRDTTSDKQVLAAALEGFVKV